MDTDRVDRVFFGITIVLVTLLFGMIYLFGGIKVFGITILILALILIIPSLIFKYYETLMEKSNILRSVRKWYRRKVYRPGRIVSKFIARDIRRDIWIISADRIDEGVIVGQVRTNNILYLSKGLVEEQGFSKPIKLDITNMWEWSGEPWGGLPDGTSIADHFKNEDDN
jgi:hypothetical protein